MADEPDDEDLTIDQLMDLDPLGLSDQHIDKIIAYQRKMRADFEAGVKPKRDQGPKSNVDLVSALGLAPKVGPVTRRKV